MWIDDQIIEQCRRNFYIEIFVPKGMTVVCGASNQASVEVCEKHCLADGVDVLKRYGGGGTVLLYPGCVVLSLGCWVKEHFQNGKYFKLLNQSVIEALAECFPEFSGLYQAGISDIVWQDRKVVGTSLFRSRNYLLYQASIIVEAQRTLIDRYLQHPSREPDYRKGRSHSEFVVGLAEIHSGANALRLATKMQHIYPRHFQNLVGDDLISPQQDQFSNLLRRVQRAQT